MAVDDANGSGRVQVSDKRHCYLEYLTDVSFCEQRWKPDCFGNKRQSRLARSRPAFLSCPAFLPLSPLRFPSDLTFHSPFKNSPTSLTTWSLHSTSVKWLASCTVTHSTLGIPKKGSTHKSWASSMLPLYTSVRASKSFSHSITVQLLREPVRVSSEGPFLQHVN